MSLKTCIYYFSHILSLIYLIIIRNVNVFLLLPILFIDAYVTPYCIK